MAIIVLYPCSQFDYITSGRTEPEAQELFEAWSAAHHPALLDLDMLERGSTIPRWETASYALYNLQQDILIVPPCCESFWSESWEKQSTDCTIIRNTIHRDDIVQQVLAARNCPAHSFDDGFVADCYALAAARFLAALLNKKLYYIHMPDETRLKTLMTDAINTAKDNQPEATQRTMQNAFSEIARTKDTYHPTQNYFIELFLVTKTLTGEPLRQLLCREDRINLFMPSSILATLTETNPETFSQLKSATEQGKVRFIVDDSPADEGEGDDGAPQPFALMPILDVADQLLAGISVYRELLNITPAAYGRLTTGLSPVLPQVLKLTEMKGAIHFAPLVGWKIKENEQSKIVWQGTDNTHVDALVRYPIEATTFLGFFELAEQLSKQISYDQVPTSVFALFPGQTSVWLNTLRRMTRYTTGLGKFSDIDNYFGDTTHSGGSHRFGYEKYPVNALMESEQNPISRWNDLYRKNTDRLVQSSLETLLKLLNRPVSDAPLAEQFVMPLLLAGTPAQSTGTIVVNPLSFARKMYADDIAVDVPPLGYAYVAPPVQTEAKTKKRLLGPFFGTNKSAPMLVRTAEDDIGRGEKRAVYVLENKYFSAKFDAVSGTLRSIFTNRSRYNQLSRQIAFRKNQTYTIPAADDIVITKATKEVGQLKITGCLVLPDGETAARFTETITIRNQSRLLEFDLMLDPLIEFDEDRWNSYIAVRYAWNDDTLIMRGGSNDGMHVLSDRKHLHAPKVIDLRHAESSLIFLSEGVPFHRRSGDRQLDTLLMVKGESQRHFRLGISVNSTNPVLASYDFLLGQEGFVFPVQSRPQNPSAWLFQIENHNVIALHWEAITESDTLIGYMVYLQETEGRRAHFALRSFVSPKHAAAMNLLGRELKKFKINDDAVLIDMHAHELLPLMVKITESQT